MTTQERIKTKVLAQQTDSGGTVRRTGTSGRIKVAAQTPTTVAKTPERVNTVSQVFLSSSQTPVWEFGGRTFVELKNGAIRELKGDVLVTISEAEVDAVSAVRKNRADVGPRGTAKREKLFDTLPTGVQSLLVNVTSVEFSLARGRKFLNLSALGDKGRNIDKMYEVNGQQVFVLKDGTVAVSEDGVLQSVTGVVERNKLLAFSPIQAKFDAVDAIIARGIEIGPKGALADLLSEAMTFTAVETDLIDRESIGRRYDEVRKEAGQVFEEQKAFIEGKGSEVTETKDEYLDRVMGPKKEFVKEVLAAAPQLREIAKEVGLASIPVYGTIRTWEQSPNWLRAVSVATDLVTLIPIIGQLSVAARAGASLNKTALNVAIAEVTSPITFIKNPIKTVKGALQPWEVLTRSKRLPLASLETFQTTVRIPVRGSTANQRAVPGVINIPDSSLQGLTPSLAIQAREELTLKAIRGEAAVTDIPGVGQVTLRQRALQTTGPAAAHTTPDIRNFLVGAEIGEKELFLAPSAVTSFLPRSATGAKVKLSDKVANAIRAGELSDRPIPGVVIFRDPELLAKLQDSAKLWRNSAEIETTLKNISLPKPDQILFTRAPFDIGNKKAFEDVTGIVAKWKRSKSIDDLDELINVKIGKSPQITQNRIDLLKDQLKSSDSALRQKGEDFLESFVEGLSPRGNKITIVVIGKPLSKAEIANLKFIGTQDTLGDIFSGPGSFTGRGATTEFDQAIELGKRAERLNDAGETFRKARQFDLAEEAFDAAEDASREASRLLAASDRSISANFANTLSPLALYWGDQDIRAGLEELGRPTPTVTTKRVTRLDEPVGPDTRGGARALDESVGTRSAVPAEAEGRQEPVLRELRDTGRPSADERVRIDGGRTGPTGEARAQPRGDSRRITTGGGPRRETLLVDDRPRPAPVEEPTTRIKIVDGDRPTPPPARPTDQPPPRTDRIKIPRPEGPEPGPPPLIPSDGPPRDPSKPKKPGRPRRTKGKTVEVEGRRVPIKGTVAWKQGFIYVVVPPPYTDVIFTDEKPAGLRLARGVRSAFKTIGRLAGGKVPESLRIKIGFFTAEVTGGKTLTFRKRPRIKSIRR